MFTIGDFARHGQVSVRMLRHYDALGLLRPARVDPATGYRYYEAAQLTRLNRVLALKDLGFTLEQVRDILDDKVTAEELRGMLRLRQAELHQRLAAETARLTRVEARLRLIESEGHMPADDIVIKSLPAVRVAELTATAGGFAPEEISPVIRPLYEELFRRLEAAGITPAGPSIAYYDQREDGTVTVHAGATVNADPDRARDFAVVDLPAVAEAATIVHRGDMDDVSPTHQALARWIADNDRRTAGPSRELYLNACGPMSEWVTELQEPLTP
ncbi:MerR family transcriptional regulator [Actinomadura kijaniata]|uniref:MerR family transcriptional regulator n=1 Tax=Actinomadura kijaniata TaxID=46161 RepID=UPI00082E5D0C|nr:MerR family transcriptional regulator [Actinomadura kijaniata]